MSLGNTLLILHDPTMILNISSYEPMFMLLMRFKSTFSEVWINERMMHFRGLAMQQHTRFCAKGKSLTARGEEGLMALVFQRRAWTELIFSQLCLDLSSSSRN